MKALLETVLGTNKDMTEEQALANLKPEEDNVTQALVDAVVSNVNTAVASSYDTAIAAPSTPESPSEQFNHAYDVTYDEDNKQYILHIVAYTDKGDTKYIKSEVFAKYLPEASHKLNALLLDKLIYTMAPGYRPRGKK
jgi:hypothetical protein